MDQTIINNKDEHIQHLYAHRNALIALMTVAMWQSGLWEM